MIKTLVYLVVAMTTTSAFLAWIDPSKSSPADSLAFADMLPLADALVAEGPAQDGTPWVDMEVLTGWTESGSYLTATADRATYHFRIGIDGRLSATRRWLDPTELANHDRTIRVQVAREPGQERMSRVQWSWVRALSVALAEQAGSETTALPVRLEAAWAEAYDLDPEVVVAFDAPDLPAS